MSVITGKINNIPSHFEKVKDIVIKKYDYLYKLFISFFKNII